jgi:hypothetical protein
VVKRIQDFLAQRGLTLSRNVLRRLEKVGIFTQSHVSLEHQLWARRYVVRGIESGGAVGEIGRYVTFCGPAGEPLPYLHPIDAVGVNGVHAVVIAPVLVRIELFRSGRTFQLLITKHEPEQVQNGRRPPLSNSVVFRGVNGFLQCAETGKGSCLTGSAVPCFWTRSGEERRIPSLFVVAVQAATTGASCVGCSHTHYLVAGGLTGGDGGTERVCHDPTISS